MARVSPPPSAWPWTGPPNDWFLPRTRSSSMSTITAKNHDHRHYSADAIRSIDIPDSKLCRQITELVRDTESNLLFNHSSRVYCFGALTGLRRGLPFDRELLYAGAMFHDMALTNRHSSPTERFEVDGANAARDFLRAHKIAPRDIDLVWSWTSSPPASSSPHASLQGRHHPSLLRRDKAQAGHDVRQRQGGCAGRQGP